jgi:hypothetical protein
MRDRALATLGRLPYCQADGKCHVVLLLDPMSTCGGAPRASRAWPLAWPSPSGPLGWQRSPASRVGPEDRFCEAVRNDLRVPLTLEEPARTMRGVPARYL